MLSRLGLVTAYGHVSARAGASMLITPAADLATVVEPTIVEVPLEATWLPPAAPAGLGAPRPLPFQARCRVDRARPPRQRRRRVSHDVADPAARAGGLARQIVPVHDSAHLLRSPGSPSARPGLYRPAKRCCCVATAR